MKHIDHLRELMAQHKELNDKLNKLQYGNDGEFVVKAVWAENNLFDTSEVVLTDKQAELVLATMVEVVKEQLSAVYMDLAVYNDIIEEHYRTLPIPPVPPIHIPPAPPVRQYQVGDDVF
ncbi:hypothetical protein D3C75_333270 [compost metagenome]